MKLAKERTWKGMRGAAVERPVSSCIRDHGQEEVELEAGLACNVMIMICSAYPF